MSYRVIKEGNYSTVLDYSRTKVIKRYELKLDDWKLYGLQCLPEIDIMCRFNHPHIMKCIKISMHMIDQLVMCDIIMEKASHILDSKHIINLPLKSKIDIAYQLISAVSYLHENRLIHRDIKPNNILIVNRVAKISDFDAIKPLYDKVAFIRGIGNNAPYCSPKLLQRYLELKDTKNEGMYEFNRYDDIWALGMSLLCMFGDYMLPNHHSTALNEIKALFTDNCNESVDYLIKSNEGIDVRNTGGTVKITVGNDIDKDIKQVTDMIVNMLQFDETLRGDLKDYLNWDLFQDIKKIGSSTLYQLIPIGNNIIEYIKRTIYYFKFYDKSESAQLVFLAVDLVYRIYDLIEDDRKDREDREDREDRKDREDHKSDKHDGYNTYIICCILIASKLNDSKMRDLNPFLDAKEIECFNQGLGNVEMKIIYHLTGVLLTSHLYELCNNDDDIYDYYRILIDPNKYIKSCKIEPNDRPYQEKTVTVGQLLELNLI